MGVEFTEQDKRELKSLRDRIAALEAKEWQALPFEEKVPQVLCVEYERFREDDPPELGGGDYVLAHWITIRSALRGARGVSDALNDICMRMPVELEAPLNQLRNELRRLDNVEIRRETNANPTRATSG